MVGENAEDIYGNVGGCVLNVADVLAAYGRQRSKLFLRQSGRQSGGTQVLRQRCTQHR